MNYLIVLGFALLSWTPPTQNTDGSPLTDLTGYKFYYGSVAGGPYLNIYPDATSLVSANVTSTLITDLAPGNYYFVGTAFNSQGEESAYSNVAAKAVPSGLTVYETQVFAINLQDNRINLLPIGTIPIGTPCDEAYGVNGRYVVDKDLVDYTDKRPIAVRPSAVVAACL